MTLSILFTISHLQTTGTTHKANNPHSQSPYKHLNINTFHTIHIDKTAKKKKWQQKATTHINNHPIALGIFTNSSLYLHF